MKEVGNIQKLSLLTYKLFIMFITKFITLNIVAVSYIDSKKIKPNKIPIIPINK